MIACQYVPHMTIFNYIGNIYSEQNFHGNQLPAQHTATYSTSTFSHF